MQLGSADPESRLVECERDFATVRGWPDRNGGGAGGLFGIRRPQPALHVTTRG